MQDDFDEILNSCKKVEPVEFDYFGETPEGTANEESDDLADEFIREFGPGPFDDDEDNDENLFENDSWSSDFAKQQQEAKRRLEAEGWMEFSSKSTAIVPGDTIRFTENVWGGKHRNRIMVGTRTNVVKISRETYSKQMQHRIYFEVLESEGDEALLVGKITYRLKSTFYNCEKYRQPWDDESEREKAICQSTKLCQDTARKQEESQDINLLVAPDGKPEKVSESKNATSNSDEDYVRKLKLSTEEQDWANGGWLQNVATNDEIVGMLEEYDAEAGWIFLGNSNDCILEGDIIRFGDPDYSYRYPKGKFLGIRLVIAKVIKIAREYYHLEYVTSYGGIPFNKKNRFRRKFNTVHYWDTYRLPWKEEESRNFNFCDRENIELLEFEEYLEYIRPVEPEIAENNDDDGSEVKEVDAMAEDLNDTDNNPSVFNREVLINDQGYYKLTHSKHPAPRQISNFVLEAKAKIVQDNNWWFDCKAVTGSGQNYENIMLLRTDFQSAAAFKSALSLNSHLEYYGNNSDTTQIQGLLTDQNPPQKAGTDKVGIHKINNRWFYVEGNNIVDQDGSTDDIVFINANVPEYKLPGLLKQPDIDNEKLQQIGARLNKFNDNSIVFPILGWMGFCFIKERLADKVNGRNPILLCQGEPGSGKTETATRIIQPIFSNPSPITNIGDATKFTFAVTASSSNMIPVHYDEWKKSVMQRWQIKWMNSMLLAVFNQTTLPRGRTDQLINDYRFTAPLVISGEMTLEAPSIKHRIIEVFFDYQKMEGTSGYFHELCKLPLGSLGKGLLQHMLKLTDEQLHHAFDDQLASVDSALEARFRDNAALARTGLWLIIDYFRANNIDVEDYDEGYNCIDDAIKETMADARKSNVDKIISDFCIMSNTRNGSGNWLTSHYHYEIKGNTLCIRMAETYNLYQRYARSYDTLAEPLVKSSFLQQLRSRKYFVGQKTARIGGNSCNAIVLNIDAMPDHIEKDFAA